MRGELLFVAAIAIGAAGREGKFADEIASAAVRIFKEIHVPRIRIAVGSLQLFGKAHLRKILFGEFLLGALAAEEAHRRGHHGFGIVIRQPLRIALSASAREIIVQPIHEFDRFIVAKRTARLRFPCARVNGQWDPITRIGTEICVSLARA